MPTHFVQIESYDDAIVMLKAGLLLQEIADGSYCPAEDTNMIPLRTVMLGARVGILVEE